MFETEIYPQKIGVAFIQGYAEIGARYRDGSANSQRVIVAIVRCLQKNGRLESGLTTYTGVSIKNPRDRLNDQRGKSIALARALSQMLPGMDRYELRLTAYAIVREMYPPEAPADKPVQPESSELAYAVPASELVEVAA